MFIGGGPVNYQYKCILLPVCGILSFDSRAKGPLGQTRGVGEGYKKPQPGPGVFLEVRVVGGGGDAAPKPFV